VRRRFFIFVAVATMLLCVATVVTLVLPGRAWPREPCPTESFVEIGKGELVVYIVKPVPNEVGPSVNDTSAFDSWKVNIEKRQTTVLGYRSVSLDAYAMFKDGEVHGIYYGTCREVAIPVFGMAVVFLTLFSFEALACWRRTRRREEFHCKCCNYNLTGNKSGVCPECGTAIKAP